MSTITTRCTKHYERLDATGNCRWCVNEAFQTPAPVALKDD